MTTTQEQIKASLSKIVNLEIAKKHFDTLTKNVEHSKSELQKVLISLEKEAKDVEELEKTSITSLFHKVIGNKEEKIEKEREEYMVFALQYKELKKSIELLEFEIDVLRNKVSELEGEQKNLENLKVQREKEISQSKDPKRNELLAIYQGLDELQREQSEIIEAHNAGKKAMESVRLVINHLNEAIKWGEWDQMSRGGGYYDYVKHGEIDKAASAASLAQKELYLFSEELKDIGYSNQDFGLNVNQFRSFMDIFFDNLISDWILQNKIKNARNSVEMVFDKVVRTLKNIEADFDKNKEKINEMLLRKDGVLLS